MKKEKAIRINLPDGAEYRRVEVTDGGISIIYAEETATDTVKVSKTVLKAIPKPTPLVGGTEVYQKDNDTGYWYCRIKDGRDEFMHLYFGDLTKDDILYTEDGKKRKFVTESQRKFRADVMNALNNMPKEGFRWIPVYKPSKNDNGKLEFVPEEKMLINLSCYQWEEILRSYSPENHSRMASLTTYFLLLLRLLKDDYATVEQLADDFKEGGLYGFAGNTYKIVKDTGISSNWLLQGYCDVGGKGVPLADVRYDHYPIDPKFNGIGFLELTK